MLASGGLLASPLAGQVATGVAGRVTDAASGAPLPAARVWLVEQPHRVESTHEDGAFSFLRLGPGRYTLVVERLGYGQFTRQITVRARRVCAGLRSAGRKVPASFFHASARSSRRVAVAFGKIAELILHSRLPPTAG